MARDFRGFETHLSPQINKPNRTMSGILKKKREESLDSLQKSTKENQDMWEDTPEGGHLLDVRNQEKYDRLVNNQSIIEEGMGFLKDSSLQDKVLKEQREHFEQDNKI